ncbi:MAG TPA: RNA polymerase sigma factor [Thermoanaerobaculia bacterium]
MMATDTAWLDACLTAARPRAIGALTRYFRDLDQAEEAFQEACLRALRSWPKSGRPDDPAAWLIFVGRNYGVNESRRRRRREEMVPEIADAGDAEAAKVEKLDNQAYRDDVLRLLFVCCHPKLPAQQQIALALRVVAGLSVPEIARAFLVSPKAMEQRITRAKRRVAEREVPFAPPTAAERAERLEIVATMIYLLFNEGYSASGGQAHIRVPLCEEAIRLARILLRLFPEEAEMTGLLALCLLQHSRRRARLDAAGDIVLLEDQDRDLWDGELIAEGLVLVEKALRRGSPGPLQVQAAIAAVHSRARRSEETDWHQIDALYAALERLRPSPVVTLNRAVAVAKTRGAAAALGLLEPLSETLAGYFHFHGARGVFLAELGELAGARAAFERALELAATPAESAHVRRRLGALEKNS